MLRRARSAGGIKKGEHAVLNRHSRLVDGLVRVVLLKALLRLDEVGARIRQSRVVEHIERGLHGGRAHRRASRWRKPAGLVKRVRHPVVNEQLRDAVVGVTLGFLASKQLERIGRRDIATGIERCREQLIGHRKQRGLLEGRHLGCARN
jgi:hypothetical protein